MKYSVLNIDELFIRSDGNNQNIVMVKSLGHQFVINDVALKILELAREYTDSADIVKRMSQLYPNVEYQVLEQDINEIMNLLGIYGAVNIEPDSASYNNIVPIKLNYAFSVAGDEDFTIVSNYIAACFDQRNVVFSQTNNLEYFSPYALRYRTFHSQEYFVYATYQKKIIACIGFIPPQNNLVLSISSLFLDERINKSENKMIVSNLCNRLITLLDTKPRKIRISISSASMTEKLADFVKYMGFSKEATLKNELSNGDLVLYQIGIQNH